MGLFDKISCEAGSLSCCCNPHRFLQPEVLRLYFAALECWIAWSVSLSICPSQFILMRMWDHPLRSFCLAMNPLCPGCLSPPLLPVCMNVFSLTPWLLDFHTIQFYGSSGYFLFLNLLLSFFWLFEEAKLITYASILAKSWNLSFLKVF